MVLRPCTGSACVSGPTARVRGEVPPSPSASCRPGDRAGNRRGRRGHFTQSLDDVHIVLEADALDPLKLDPVFDIVDIPTPPLGATARLVPHGDHHRMEVELENRGEVNLTGMRLKLAWRDDSGIELIDREAILPVLGAEESGRFDLEVRLLEGAPAEGVPVELRVGADRFPSLLTMPISVPIDGQDATLAAPFVDAQTPTRSEEERLIVPSRRPMTGVSRAWWCGGMAKLLRIPGEIHRSAQRSRCFSSRVRTRSPSSRKMTAVSRRPRIGRVRRSQGRSGARRVDDASGR